MTVPLCPDCGLEMDEGFVRDQTYGGSTQSEWIEGPVTTSFWTGVRIRGRRSLAMVAWRCPNCALIRFYAPE